MNKSKLLPPKPMQTFQYFMALINWDNQIYPYQVASIDAANLDHAWDLIKQEGSNNWKEYKIDWNFPYELGYELTIYEGFEETYKELKTQKFLED